MNDLKRKLRFIEWYCGELSRIQHDAIMYHIKNETFYGVGTAFGRSKFWPLVSGDGIHFDVIDGTGSRQLASSNRVGYTSGISTSNY